MEYPKKLLLFITLGCYVCIVAGRNIYDQKKSPIQQRDKLFESLSKHPSHLGGQSNNHNLEMTDKLNGQIVKERLQKNPVQHHFLSVIHQTAADFTNLGDLYLPSPDIANPECARDLSALRQALLQPDQLLKDKRLWPIKLVDSWGKAEDGLLIGNLRYFGFYEECLNLNVQDKEYNAHFKGQYCTLAYRSSNGSTSSSMQQLDDVLDKTILSKVENVNIDGQLRMPYISALIRHPLISSYSTCMPSTCTTEELEVSINKTLVDLDMEISVVKCQTVDQPLDIGASEIFGIVFFSILSIIMIISALLDIWSMYTNNQKFRQGAWRYLLAFSAVTNLPKLFHLETKRKEGVISCLHGIRFLTITWVIMGHQAAFSIYFDDNPVGVPKLADPLQMQIITNGTFSVDTFFFMGGLLLCYGMLKEFSHNKRRFNYPFFVLQRFIRLFPAMAIAACFVGTVSTLLVSGPQSWGWREEMVASCRAQWYWDISFVSNLLMVYKGAQGANCIPVSWYAGVDFQLYIIMPIVILPVVYWKKKGMLWLGFWTFVAFLVPSVITAVYNLWPDALQVIDSEASTAYNNHIYLLPWSRASPYLIGCWTGWIIYYFTGRNRENFPKLKFWHVFSGWSLATCLALSVLLGMWPYNQLGFPDNVPEVPSVEAIFYGGLSRGVWAIAIAWLVLACHWGYAGPINWFLSHPSWQPLSRLTYCFYICSLPIQFGLMYGYHRPPHFTLLNKIQETLLVLFITGLFGTMLTLVAESPAVIIQKLVFTKEKKEKIQVTGNIESQKTTSSEHQNENTDP